MLRRTLGSDFEIFEIDIRLVEAVEQYQRVGSGRVRRFAMLAILLKKGPIFTATGIVTSRLDGGNDIQIAQLDCARG